MKGILVRLERPQEAIMDANKTLEFHPYSTKAILAKGEALYTMGLFENALVQFHQGWRFRADPAIKKWMKRCRDEILNTLGDPGKEYDVEKVILEINCLKIEIQPEPRKNIKKSKEKCKPRKKLTKGKMTLGKMDEDIEFLQKFLDFQVNQPVKTKLSVRHN